MKLITSVVQLSIGAVFGIGMVLSCGDSSPDRADASTCDCPTSEPPIAGRLVTAASELGSIAPGEQGGAGVMCPQGTQFISGGCTAANPSVLKDITLQQSGFDPITSSWGCSFKNNELTPVQVKATALCLKPAT